MIPVTQSKVVVRNSKSEVVVNGNCYAAAIASIMELPLTEVPNVEVLFSIEDAFWNIVMQTFLNHKGWQLITDERYKVWHDVEYGRDNKDAEKWVFETSGKLYLVSGDSPRGVKHICIFKNGKMVHDPHPTKEGILTYEIFETLEKL